MSKSVFAVTEYRVFLPPRVVFESESWDAAASHAVNLQQKYREEGKLVVVNAGRLIDRLQSEVNDYLCLRAD